MVNALHDNRFVAQRREGTNVTARLEEALAPQPTVSITALGRGEPARRGQQLIALVVTNGVDGDTCTASRPTHPEGRHGGPPVDGKLTVRTMVQTQAVAQCSHPQTFECPPGAEPVRLDSRSNQTARPSCCQDRLLGCFSSHLAM